eukprot:TRINITY_DN6045_c0_g1_i2.p1 TRINITY_DN6045_c0_g1~~TRINITY_DN6045_c0_g1_i2.p1  ORF type:complete len:315 (+),score=109.91 TRINITY_DN6045_c0_g1_i2:68-1012(+)
MCIRDRFRSQKKLISKSHAELSMLQSRIAGWNEVLHRKEAKQANSSEVELALILDLEDLKQKIVSMVRKVKYLDEYPEDALRHATMLERIYLWFYCSTNHISSMKESDLCELEDKLKGGTYLLPSPLIEYYIEKYREEKIEKIAIKKQRYDELTSGLEIEKSVKEELKLGSLSFLEKSDAPKEEEPREDKHEKYKKSYGTFQLILKIIVALANLLFTSSQGICFTFMVIAHTCNGNLLSLFYVMSIFCYALIAKCRPGSLYWKIMLRYTGIVIVLKYICVFLEHTYILIKENLDPTEASRGFKFLQAEVHICQP